ncbi:MAG: hypothetical protein GY708_03290 [Actinomycetia bacterium]|nr:hypothetical protein [Actinomycetes bacterium]
MVERKDEYEASEIGLEIIDAHENGTDAFNLTKGLDAELPAFRWHDFVHPFALMRKLSEKEEKKPSAYRVEHAAMACGRFAQSLANLEAVFPDARIEALSVEAPTWKQRVWVSGREQATDISAEMRPVLEVVTELALLVHRGHPIVRQRFYRP